MLLLLNILLFVVIIGGSMIAAGTQADASSGLTRAQINQAKQTAAAHFRHRGNICNNGQAIKIRVYSKNWPPSWSAVNPSEANTLGEKFHALAYAQHRAGFPGVKQARKYCTVWFNSTLMREKGRWYYPHFCTILTHEVGHLAGYTYRKNGKTYRHKIDAPGTLMYPSFRSDIKEVRGCWGRWD